MAYFLAIVGHEDKPLYELEFSSSRQSSDAAAHFPPSIKELSPYITHASLDVIDETQWTTQSLYLRAVDRFYGYTVSAFVTPGNVRLLLLHDTKNEEGIRQLFLDIWDAYVKTLMSPFYKEGLPIDNPHFDAKVRQMARKHL